MTFVNGSEIVLVTMTPKWMHQQIFAVSRTTIYFWLRNSKPGKKSGPTGPDKLAQQILLDDIRTHFNKFLREKAVDFSVRIKYLGRPLSFRSQKTLKYTARDHKKCL